MQNPQKLIKCLLTKDFYEKYHHKLKKDLFADNNMKSIFNTLNKAFETINTDLTVDSLKELHYTYNPALSGPNKQVLEDFFNDLKKLDLTKETSEVVLKKSIEQHLWEELAGLAISGGDGLNTNFQRAQEILDQIRKGIVLNENYKIVEGSIEEMLAQIDQQLKWEFNISSVRKIVNGIGPTVFMLIAARTNVGKTGLVTSFTAGPEGFLEQGANVLYVGTEEAAVRTRLRMASCYSGFTKEQMLDPKLRRAAQDEFDKVSKNLTVLDMAGYSIEELENYLKDRRHPVDILCVDILDKLSSNGDNSQDVERLGQLYLTFRELLKKYDVAGIGTCQASIDADNRSVFGTEALANSKTAKGGELDLCFCLGRHLDTDAQDTGVRTLNVPKNKLTGIEGNVTIWADFPRSRFRA